ncbi:MAG: precorrin-6y C5,15-methyltransferase (decarboxylating) subunit CbiE [Desulfovibrio sp.]|jgi:precorrin-6Y C5,15-methyltransferase (decarboxylating)|nr:precorrin-6y C5,15-methyltransferase (decarboxylating) subunit CbiE [Desulfovibrio sp.]
MGKLKTADRAPIPVVGVESGAPLPGEALRLLQTAEVVCAGKELLDRLGDTDGAPNRELLAVAAPLDPVLERLDQLRELGRNIVVLADGDPLFFGIGRTLARRWGSDAVRIVPAVGCLQLACARLGLPWHDVRCVSLHGTRDIAPLLAHVNTGSPLCVLLDDATGPNAVAGILLDRGADWFTGHVFRRLGQDGEERQDGTLAELAGGTFGSNCTLVLVPAGPVRQVHLGLPNDGIASDDDLRSKGPVRAAALACLEIAPWHTVWDVGAGSGAVALEAAALAHRGRVCAVERSPGRTLAMRKNRRRFGAAIVDIIEGKAPDCLEQLPRPHRVFIGGGLSEERARDILETVARRLLPGGKVVANCALLETLEKCQGFFRETWGEAEVVSLQAAHSHPLGKGQHLRAMNPVFIVTARKPEDAT